MTHPHQDRAAKDRAGGQRKDGRAARHELWHRQADAAARGGQVDHAAHAHGDGHGHRGADQEQAQRACAPREAGRDSEAHVSATGAMGAVIQGLQRTAQLRRDRAGQPQELGDLGRSGRSTAGGVRCGPAGRRTRCRGCRWGGCGGRRSDPGGMQRHAPRRPPGGQRADRPHGERPRRGHGRELAGPQRRDHRHGSDAESTFGTRRTRPAAAVPPPPRLLLVESLSPDLLVPLAPPVKPREAAAGRRPQRRRGCRPPALRRPRDDDVIA